jgi:uncharacterized protein YbbC (DUF1343 family)
VVPGADRLVAERLDLLAGKRVALVANHTTRLVGGTHLVDTLLARGVKIVRVFAPEHGFRGDAEAGQYLQNDKDTRTGLPIVSLYGSQLRRKPRPEHLADVDVVIFDMQDVGARFYTYISTLAFVMEACGQQQKPLIILDRPNPNGWYVDGPTLDLRFYSFSGLHPIPVVHGLTVGEYARMVNDQRWMKAQATLTVIPCEGYHHRMTWAQTGLPWRPPSPNLPTPEAAYYYPILCWYEQTPVSVGRGTDRPFERIGMPEHTAALYLWKQDSMRGLTTPDDGLSRGTTLDFYGMQLIPEHFTPRPTAGKAENPPHNGRRCWGYRLQGHARSGRDLWLAGLRLLWVSANEYHEHYKALGRAVPAPFFWAEFSRLAGNDQLQQQIQQELSPEAIAATWATDLARYRQLRRQYLLYPD